MAMACMAVMAFTGCHNPRPEVTAANTYVDSLPEPSDAELPIVGDSVAQLPADTAPDLAPEEAPQPRRVAEKRVVAHSEDGYMNIRVKPTVNSDTIGRLLVGGEKALYLGTSGEWYHVKYKGKEGYVKCVYAAIDSTTSNP